MRRTPAIEFTRLLNCHIAFRSSQILCDPSRSQLTICVASLPEVPHRQVKLAQRTCYPQQKFNRCLGSQDRQPKLCLGRARDRY